MKKKIIGCQIFSDEITAVLPEQYKNIDITWINAGLHTSLEKLETTLKKALTEAEVEGVDARVLIGNNCHPDMCNIINNHCGKILGTKNCIDAIYDGNIEDLEKNNTMVITPGWIRCFPNMMETAGWDSVDVRQLWGRYDRILLLDPGVNPLTDEEILEFYELTQVPIEIQQIDLEYFQEIIIELLDE